MVGQEQTGAVRSEPSIRLGRGRSAVVFKQVALGEPLGEEGTGRDRALAVKVFTGEPMAKIVNYATTGAPNPYTWNEEAIRCAALRRQLLTDLVEYWFGGEVGVANATGWGFNDRMNAYELRCEFCPGRSASLHHPFSGPSDGQLRDLLTTVMKPLQEYLRETGFDGLVWQAGKSNPVATSNFLRHQSQGRPRWTWIDLESGVPALFPINPIALLTFYLPKCFKHRRPLFDDVDIERLRAWVDANAEPLERKLGAGRYADLRARVDELDVRQAQWKALGLGHRSIEYQRVTGRITDEQAAWYRTRLGRWYARELRRGMELAVTRTGRLLGRLLRFLTPNRLKQAARITWLLLASQEFRTRTARSYVARRIRVWRQRDQLTAAEAAILRRHLRSEEASAYLTDFGMHLAIKPFVKTAQWGIVPSLWAAGLLGPMAAASLMIFGGMLARTAYTSYRFVHATAGGDPKPWVALGAGLLPVLGNAAYPIQVVFSGTGDDAKLAQFIVYDTVTRVGELVPIWGGRDTRIEHWFNRLGDLIVHDRQTASASRRTQAEATPGRSPAQTVV